MTGTRTALVAAALAIVAMIPAGCGSNDSGKSVDVTLADYSITPQPASVPAGDVTFELKNTGSFVHEFVVFKIPSAADIPTKANGEANEEAVPEAAHMGEAEDINPGATAKLDLKLDPGKYVFLCNRVDGTTSHYQRGMHTEFTVS
jgi:uncharacterized cupredoxin-like copper-binding protein